MLKDKIRIYVLAKELDVDCKDLIALCHRLEFDIKNQQLIGERKIIVNAGTDISKKPVWNW